MSSSKLYPESEVNNRFDTAVILRNPENPSSVAIANNIYKKITKGERNISSVYIEDSAQSPEGYAPLLNSYDQSNKNAWLVVGGDGTFSQFANSRPKSPVMIVPGGYANDTYKMLYGSSTLHYPGYILAHGQRTVIHPLEINSYKSGSDLNSIIKTLDVLDLENQISPDDSELAFGYWGIGLSGLVSNHLAQNNVREVRDKLSSLGKFIYSGKLISSIIPKSPPLEIVHSRGSRIRHEVLFANGNRMAKLIRFGGVDIRENRAALLELEKSTHTSFISLLGRSALLEKYTDFGTNTYHIFGVKSDKDMYSQRDGEAKKQESGTVFKIGISDYGVNVITVR